MRRAAPVRRAARRGGKRLGGLGRGRRRSGVPQRPVRPPRAEAPAPCARTVDIAHRPTDILALAARTVISAAHRTDILALAQ